MLFTTLLLLLLTHSKLNKLVKPFEVVTMLAHFSHVIEIARCPWLKVDLIYIVPSVNNFRDCA